MEGYECFIFAWNGTPNGGSSDLAMCCDTKDEAFSKAEKLECEYDNVQVMDKYGDTIE